jgi:hypothetical protein
MRAARSIAGAAAVAASIAVAGGCRSPDPRAEVELSDLETYWAVDPPAGDTNFLAPVVRFQLVNKASSSRSIQAMSTFRRKGEGPAWSSAWQQASPLADGNPLPIGGRVLVVLKPEGEGRYTYRGGAPEEMFQNEGWKDVSAEVFVRVGSSSWTKFTDVDVARRLGSQTVEAFQ